MAGKFAGIENKGLRAELLETEFAALLARVEVAEVASASASAQNVTLKDQTLRLSADFENFRKRTVRTVTYM
jgi:molecular chaperone GrpE (heat shock protein)